MSAKAPRAPSAATTLVTDPPAARHDSVPARTQILAAKLAPRPSTARPLARARLEALLAPAGATPRLVLVRAPAGFGKTTVLAQWCEALQARGTAFGWLTLDEADNDASRFIAHMVAAFQSIDPTLALVSLPAAGEAPGMMRRGDVDGAALDLVQHISTQRAHFVLCLDNVELVQNPAVLGVLRMLLDALPPCGQVMVASRDVPDLGLGRLRAHGQLLELGANELRFSTDETRALLRAQCSQPLSEAQLDTLHARTEGWAAALWLATLALRGHADTDAFLASFSGASGALADYLLEDVLARLPDDLRGFLLDVSVLDELHAGLCDAVTGRDDSHALLARLHRAGLFVVPEDSEGIVYRYHTLFRDFLYGQLRSQQPTGAARARLLHQRAAQWYAARQRVVPAIDQAIRSGDRAFAVGYLARDAEWLLWQGRVRLLIRLCERLPAALADDAPVALRLAHAWALTYTRRHPEALAQLARIEASPDLPDGLRAQCIVLRHFTASMLDQPAEMLAAWEALARDLPVPASHTDGIRLNAHAYCLIAADRFDDAQATLDAARRANLRIGSGTGQAVTSCLESSIDLARGQPRQAVTRLRAALAGMAGGSTQNLSSSAIIVGFLAEMLYHLGELAQAGRLLDTYLPLLDEVAAPDQVITSYICLARVKADAGDTPRAADLLDELERLGHRHTLPRLVCSAQLERARVATQQGDFARAGAFLAAASAPRAWASQGGMSPHANDVDDPFTGRMRLAIHTGRAAETLVPLADAMRSAGTRGRLRRHQTLRLLYAMALARTGDAAQAREQLALAEAFAAASGLTRSLADEGPALAALLATGTTPAPLPPPVESLSGQERRILVLLAEGHANKGIAERLHVAESTVKSHLKRINGKLGAENRTHAVALARRMGLLPPG